jgi:ubiquinone/menaquinone biosynthesis C-methylase UbiE
MKNQFGKSYFENEIMDEKTSLKREGYLKIVKKIITELPPGSKILDVGCGKGAYLKDINRIRSDLELYGVDIGNVKEFLPDYINFEVSSGDDLPFEDEKFDLIICFHVL